MPTKHEFRHCLFEYPCWIEAGSQEILQGRVFDISPDGATVVCQGATNLPAEFNLYLTRDRRVARKCVVDGRDGNRIALSFKADQVPKP